MTAPLAGEPVIRRAVGAVVLDGGDVLLVRKVRVTSAPGGPPPAGRGRRR